MTTCFDGAPDDALIDLAILCAVLFAYDDVMDGRRQLADLPTLVAQASALVDDGMGVKDACAQVIAATPGAASRRELYDAVLRSRG